MIMNYPNCRMKHCETGAFVNMMKYYGMDISESMAFGIGSGLYFLYSPLFKMQGVIYPAFRSWPTTIIKKASNRLQLNFHEVYFGNNTKRASIFLDKLVERQYPVGVVVNVKGLPYFNVMGGEVDFNGHIVTVIGKANKNYIIADTDSRLQNDDFVLVNENDFSKIRFSKGVAAPHGHLFYFDDRNVFKNNIDNKMLKKAIEKGLRETCDAMLRIPFPYFGTKGILYFSKDMKNWEQKYNRKQICYRLLWYYRVIERAGTGGAGYRYLFSDFLKEASDLFQKEILNDCSKRSDAAADYWRQFSLGCRRYLKQDGITLNELADLIAMAGCSEYDVFYNIKKHFLGK